MVSSANLPEVTSNEHAIQKLQDDWEAANAPLRAQYEAQLRADEEKLITAQKFVPLWYFLPEALKEAKERNRDTVNTNRFQLATDDESGLTFLGTHSTRASANAIPDAKLSWAQVSLAKSSYLAALPLGNYPPKFITMFARFYANMDMHPELHEDNGNQVMAHYHKSAGREPKGGSETNQCESNKRSVHFTIENNTTTNAIYFSLPSSPLLSFFLITMDHNATATLLNATSAMYDNATTATTATYATQQLAMTATFNRTLNPRNHRTERSYHATEAADAPTPIIDNRATSLGSPFGKETSYNFPDATGALGGTSTTYVDVRDRHFGMANATSSASGTPNNISKSPKAPTRAWSYVQNGNAQMAAQSAAIQRSTDAQAVQAPPTALKDVLTASKLCVSTPLRAESWQTALSSLQLTAKYPTLVNSILHGFDAGIPTITHTFTPPNPTPNQNQISIEEHQRAFQDIMTTELSRGCWL
ncbi:hypothetical protein BT96DRAFT_991103 [Gymnopus androsaceus JB14]|uniref:Uncharacterized protein n=1 Tax=Gymnopus androsaceus JB14 TaxID=1447944 RepID=A0A6A4HZR5_9AGAR|nr:hypothetical protein BT96DRAFT_991103 [Gymnopus androsaceus JB14]